jgi:negative regulator of sigma E activity
MRNSTRRTWLLSLPAAIGLPCVALAQKPETKRRREPEPGNTRPWFTRAPFLTAAAAVVAAVGGVIAALRRTPAKG